MDALVILELIDSCNVSLHPLGALIADIRQFLARDWTCSCQHTLREGNFCADMLSKMGCDLEDELQIFRSPPSSIKMVIEADARGVSFPRGFVMT